MLKKIIVLVTMLSVLYLIMDCTRTVKKRGIEIDQEVGDLIGLIMPIGDTLRFDGNGGAYDSQTGLITGLSSDETKVRTALDEGNYVILEVHSDSGSVTLSLTPSEFTGRGHGLRKTKIIKAILKSGDIVKFSGVGAYYDPHSKNIRGISAGQGMVEIPINEISYVYTKHYDAALTAAAVVLTAIGVVVVIALIDASKEDRRTTSSSTTESCPFVYSWDGTQYMLDAEPLGGATNKAFERSDYSVLEFAVHEDGNYRLLVKNEMKEVQYLDQMSLLMVDHPKGTRVGPGADGKLRLYSNPQAPIMAVNENGQSILHFVNDLDSVCWQTDMDSVSLLDTQNYRHHLEFKFEKPANEHQARLIYNAGTSLWGSQMIRKMYEARGDAVEEWYQIMEMGGLKALQTLSFFDREELFWLKTWLGNDHTIGNKGLIVGGGPLVIETHVMDLDISDVEGETLTLNINPPKGFWSIDYMAIEYGPFDELEVTETPITEAIDQDGNNVSDLLREKDGNYFEMPTNEKWVKLLYSISDEYLGSSHTVVLKTSGYYKLILDKGREEKTALINQMLKTPGAIVEYSLEEYAAWADSIMGLLQD